MDTIFHAGEVSIQKKLGEEQIASTNGKGISDSIIHGAIKFIEKQPIAIVGSISSAGQLWVSLLVGNAGFVKVPKPNIVFFDMDLIQSTREDIFYTNIQDQTEVATLFIDFNSRKRFRVNGRISKSGSAVNIEVREAYPNCPKYIQRRIPNNTESFENDMPTITRGNGLRSEDVTLIMNADTFFIGSSSDTGKLDASHRGGNRGFVKILSDNTLKIPDYKGNSFYNTLGNIVGYPNVGILFVNFEKRETLQLTGEAELVFDQTSDLDHEQANHTGRYLLFRSQAWIHVANHHNLKWDFLEYSPVNP
jgi:predicted pyridoxine 5'-phosphate oxidase superfamily flavin-nucleotide-binding protein